MHDIELHHIKVEAFSFFTPSESHYSMKKMASLAGLGTNACIQVGCDEFGRMCPKLLRQQIQSSLSKNQKPFLVNATSGTTVLGAFDPLEEISKICKEYGLWLHVDAALGGSVLLSSTHRHQMKGIEFADSMAWNPHKAMGVPLQCSAFLVRQKGLLYECFSSNANYLFQADKLFGEFDVGDKTIQCGRKPDAFKLWLTWKSKGNKGFEAVIDKLYENAKYLRNKIKQKPNFLLVVDSNDTFNVCFWYLPSKFFQNSFQNLDHNLTVQSKTGQVLHKVTAEIKAQMQSRGKTLVAYQPLGEKPNFFKICMNSTVCTREDLDFVLDEIDNIAQVLYGEMK